MTKVTMRVASRFVLVFVFCISVDSSLTWAQQESQDNRLTPEEQSTGWKLLFDGQSTEGWMSIHEKPLPERHVQNGSLNPHPCDYMLVLKELTSDFELSLDFKLSPKCNSGVFLRTFPLKPRPGKDVGFNGIEIAIDDTTSHGFHDSGAIYDLVAPSTNAMKPIGEWNRLLVIAKGSQIKVELNSTLVSKIDLDQWTKPNERPDGTPHKFDVAYKNHPRSGYIGLQDHGSDCWYKNIKLRTLSK